MLDSKVPMDGDQYVFDLTSDPNIVDVKDYVVLLNSLPQSKPKRKKIGAGLSPQQKES